MATISSEDWGALSPGSDARARLWTLASESPGGIRVTVCSVGAAVTSVLVPVGGDGGGVRDVALGYGSLDAYPRFDCGALVGNGKQNFGTAVGRCANRVKDGSFEIDGTAYCLGKNNGPNHLHGGSGGFFSRNFACFDERVADGAATLTLAYRSQNGEEGYPGAVNVFVTYTVKEKSLTMKFSADNATSPTLVSMTSHVYWNLSGHNSGSTVAGHKLFMPNCKSYTATDDSLAISGIIESVLGTKYDFTDTFRPLGESPGL